LAHLGARSCATPTRIERRLAAILSADAKGYSRLMAADDVGTLRTLNAHRSVMRAIIDAYGGRLVDDPGDNLLAEFASGVSGVCCAVEIQCALGARNARLAEDRRLEFRIGVNFGDVIAHGARLYGDAVNIAARIEALAESGGVCVSGLVHDQAVSRLALHWELLGERSLKNIGRLVRVYRLQFEPQLARDLHATRSPLIGRASVAVLPFRQLSPADELHHVGAGIVERIIGALAAIPDIFVVSPSVTTRFTAGHDVGVIGRELGVRYVLSGTIRRTASDLRISTELADVATRTILWARKTDACGVNLVALEERITELTVRTIAVQVRDAETRRALRMRPPNVDHETDRGLTRVAC